MTRWFRYYEEALDDPKVQTLPPALFKERFLAAVRGQENEFSRFIRFDRGVNGTQWSKKRKLVFLRDDFTCAYCGERGGRLECDHILPVSRGGNDDLSNLATACFFCNRSKGDKTPEEWLQ